MAERRIAAGDGGDRGRAGSETTIHLVNQPGAAGAFVMYHRASSNALSSGTGPQGTFYAVEVQLSFSNGQCSAGMYV